MVQRERRHSCFYLYMPLLAETNMVIKSLLHLLKRLRPVLVDGSIFILRERMFLPYQGVFLFTSRAGWDKIKK